MNADNADEAELRDCDADKDDDADDAEKGDGPRSVFASAPSLGVSALAPPLAAFAVVVVVVAVAVMAADAA